MSKTPSQPSTSRQPGDEHTRQQTIETIRKMITDIHVAMLTTIGDENVVRSRPMITAEHEFDGDLWFFTNVSDPKVTEIERRPHVNVSYSSPGNDRYLSLSGKATVIRDPKKVELLWSDAMRQWFAEGPERGDLALIRIDVGEAEYWDSKASRVGGFTRLLSGSRDRAEDEHEKISWPESAVVT